MSLRTLYVVDGHSQAYMAFHAMGELTAPDGRPTGATYGFLNMLRKLVREHAPDHLLIAFDTPGKTFRHEQFEQYKATRPGMPDALREQLATIKRILAAWPVPVIEAPGYEADDLLAAVCRRFAGERKVVLVTMDKDARQLLDEGHVEIFDYRRDRFLTAGKLLEVAGIRPEQVADYLTMVGDTSDNLPGIPRVGHKTAVRLLALHGTLDAVLAAADGISGKLGESLRAARDDVPAMRNLVRLDAAAPFELSLEDCRTRPPDAEALAPIFRELGFNRLLEGLAPAPPPPAPVEAALHVAQSPEQVAEALRHAARAAELAVEPTRDGVGLCWEPASGWFLPWSYELVRLLAARRPARVAHDVKAALHALVPRGLEPGFACDTLLAAYLLDPLQSSYALETLAQTYLGLAPEQLDQGQPLPLFDDQDALSAALRANLALRLAAVLRPRLEREGLVALLETIELPLAPVLFRMEQAGICIDQAALFALSDELAQGIEQHRQRIFELAGEEFNIDSPKQTGELLFDRLGLPHGRRTATGWSTDAAVLEQLAHQHPLPAELLAYRTLVKLKNTYVDALPRLVDPRTGRVHTRFHQAATATGRLSSSQPNLQNIPIRTELGRPIRAAFIAGAERAGDAGGLFGDHHEPLLLVSADYSQVELRILAHVSGDPALRQAFLDGDDIHRAVAAHIAGVPAGQVTADQRRGAKTVNFGIVYGQTPFGLAQELGISQDDARQFIARYFERFPRVKQFTTECIVRARAEREVRTLHGRLRRLPEIDSRTYSRRAFAERTAVNTVIQGTAADLIKLAMIRVDRRLVAERLPARLLLSIHDELLLECREEAVPALCELLREEMTGAMKLDVPLVVDVGVGRNWLEAGSGQQAVAR